MPRIGCARLLRGRYVRLAVWYGNDEFGVPERMFGSVPEDFFGAVGRVVMVSALVENKLAAVLTQLAQVPIREYAGKSASQLVEQMDKLAETRGLPLRLVELRDEILATAVARNEVTHSLWPSPTMDRAWGWREIRSKRRDVTDGPVVEVTYDGERLRALIGQLVAVHDVLRSLLSSGELTEPDRSSSEHQGVPERPDTG